MRQIVSANGDRGTEPSLVPQTMFLRPIGVLATGSRYNVAIIEIAYTIVIYIILAAIGAFVWFIGKQSARQVRKRPQPTRPTGPEINKRRALPPVAPPAKRNEFPKPPLPLASKLATTTRNDVINFNILARPTPPTPSTIALDVTPTGSTWQSLQSSAWRP
jgi:hypothetical protein